MTDKPTLTITSGPLPGTKYVDQAAKDCLRNILNITTTGAGTWRFTQVYGAQDSIGMTEADAKELWRAVRGFIKAMESKGACELKDEPPTDQPDGPDAQGARTRRLTTQEEREARCERRRRKVAVTNSGGGAGCGSGG